MATAAHVIVADLEHPVLEREDAHHLKSVLRLRPGEAVGATDGRGGYRLCEWTGGPGLSPVGSVSVAPARRPLVTVGLVPVKGDRPEWAVQKLAELGVDRIVVLSSDRSVVRWEGDRLASHLARLERVGRAAVMQSRQVWLPAVVGGPAVRAVLGSGGSGALGEAGDLGAGLALADMGGGVVSAGVHTILVGPEGGWSDAERAAAGSRRISLGPAVLRAETAAVAAGVLLTSLRAGLVGPAGPCSERLEHL